MSRFPGRADVDVRGPVAVMADQDGWTLESVGWFVTRALSAYQEECGALPAEAARAPQEAVPALAWMTRRIRSRDRPVRLTASWHSWAERGRIDPEFVTVARMALSCGGTLRIVIDEQSARDDAVAGTVRDLVGLGAQVRVHKSDLPDLLVLDGEAAVVHDAPCQTGPAGPPQLVVRGGMVASLATLVAAAWANASELAAYQRLQAEDGSLSDSVLSLLSAGCKDEVAARKLNMSVRTYRRHVAGIMQRLNAASRFQAGLHAARLVCQSAEGDDPSEA